jgi:phosphoheptose isomerase
MTMLSMFADAHVKALAVTVAGVESTWAEIASHAATALSQGHTLLFCGNGGSACDAMHIAGELVGRFVNDRKALPAIALSADSGILTAIGNDYGFDRVFSRQVEAYGKQGSLLFALSTSGTSPNVVKALKVASEIGMKTVLLTGERGRNAPVESDYRIVAASEVTAHVQEIHILLLHALAAMIEAHLAM